MEQYLRILLTWNKLSWNSKDWERWQFGMFSQERLYVGNNAVSFYMKQITKQKYHGMKTVTGQEVEGHLVRYYS